MQTISKQDLLSILAEYPDDVFLVDDKEIDPFEIRIILKHVRKNKQLPGGMFSDFIEDEGGCRKLVWMDSAGFGLDSWLDTWREKSKKTGKNIYELLDMDRDVFFLWSVFFMSEKTNYIRKNAVSVLKKRYSCESEEELYLLLGKYINEHSIKPKYKYICRMTDGYTAMQKRPTLILYKLGQYKLKFRRKFLHKRLQLKSIPHNLFTRKKFIVQLKMNGVLPEHWKLMKKWKGSSASALIKAERDGWTEIIKGNELKEYNALPNEISAQKKLCERYEDEKWYRGMTSVDEKEKWIGYPYLDYKDLTRYINKHELTESQLERLGAFLLEAVRKLKETGIVHNDLRADNIMITTTEDGEFVYRLIDFGCACVDGKSPWHNTFWGRYFSNVVCGDYRYSPFIVDDAVSAYLVYIESGGKTDDPVACALRAMFGGVYYSIPYEWYGDRKNG